MKYRIEIRKELDEDIVIYARENSPELQKLEALLQEPEPTLIGYRDDTVTPLDPSQIYCFSVEQNKVFAMTENERYQLKERLYLLEERFRDSFIKINQSCLVNITKLERFDTSLGGSLIVILKNGYRDYVSRRQVKAVKERIGF